MKPSEIIFKGFHADSQSKKYIYLNRERLYGKWVYGYFSKNNDKNYISDNMHVYAIIPDTLCQYSGMNDMHDIPIFDNDVCTAYQLSKNNINGVDIIIKFENGAFNYGELSDMYTFGKYNLFSFNDCQFGIDNNNIEVKGNKFDYMVL